MQFFVKDIFKQIYTCTIVVFLGACGGGGGSSTATTPTQPVSLSATVDGIMSSTMASTGVTAATVTIMHNGVVLHDKGYGFLDAAGTIPLPASALMVTASIVKPVTASAIQTLASNGTLALSDHVFCTGSNTPCWLSADLLSSSTDPRVANITIQQLIAHEGGWDISQHGNVDFDKLESVVQSSLALSTPPAQTDDIRYWMAKPLDFTPGARAAYTNFGYLLLGRIIAQASNTSYLQYLQNTILRPLGVASADFSGAASLLADRNPREPNYITSIMAPSIFAPGTTVICTNGAINTLNWVSATTSITTSKAMATFAGSYLIQTNADGTDEAQDGIPLAGKTNDGFHFGNYPGTSAIIRQLPSGVSYAVLMNKSNETGSVGYQGSLMTSIDAAIAAAGLY
ncbi:serine hydrolase domain-containing protein [Solimicrobium silvestre]|uniref:Beta-lactamase n=1 Tax=Solimicrobium silvestre TaxID=2099400 RepID=A0A2S9GWQ1_9BURK|nr:serine hydrolase domain-containing protein [Solimicrobium silvestre]PRC92140.1 Beta-lactamase [Solimicrobium silvestre]